MSIRALTRVACATVLLATCLAGAASAQVFDKRTTFSFRNPTSVPGVTLPPGDYLFRIVDGYSRSVVQVLSADGTKPYAMFFTIPVWRNQPSDNSEVRFMETAAGMPQAVKEWWYVGESTGFEFVFPREQARRLAQGTGERVATTQAWPGDTTKPDFAWITPEGNETPYDEHESAAIEPAGPVLEGRLAVAEPVIDTTAPREALPKTGSDMTVRVLGGVLALAVAMVLRRSRMLFQ